MHKKKILVIEDNDGIRENTAEILELANYEVFVAENGKKGVEGALQYAPDLIICDIMMPGLDGYGVLHAIHKNDAIKNTPFIFLTAKTERADFRKGMELGADDYITKPFNGTELLNAVDSRLKKIAVLKEELVPVLEGVQLLVSTYTGTNALHSIAEGRNTNKYKKKQTIYSEGNNPHGLFFVITGKVKTYKTNDNGKELVTDLFNAGDFMGYNALLRASVYSDTAEALEETELALVPKEDFIQLVYNSPEIAQTFIRMLAGNVADKENQLLGLAYNSLRRKVADAILLLQKKFGSNTLETFQIDFSRENLAMVAGTATESLIRTLGDFRIEKLININEGVITIINQKKLENLLN